MDDGARVQDVVDAPRVVEETCGGGSLVPAGDTGRARLGEIALPLDSITLQRTGHQLQPFLILYLLSVHPFHQQNADFWLFDKFAGVVVVLLPLLGRYFPIRQLTQPYLLGSFSRESVLLSIDVIRVFQHGNTNYLQLLRLAVKLS